MNAHDKAYEYSYRIHWSPADLGYIATVAEFPAMQGGPAANPHRALAVLMSSVVDELHSLDAAGDPRPLAMALT